MYHAYEVCLGREIKAVPCQLPNVSQTQYPTFFSFRRDLKCKLVYPIDGHFYTHTCMQSGPLNGTIKACMNSCINDYGMTK